MCDNVAYKMAGVGDITIKFENGFVHTLNRVKYILQMDRNLISVGELGKIGFTGGVGSVMIKIFKGALKAFKAVRKNGIYITYVEVISGTTTIASINIDTHKSGTIG